MAKQQEFDFSERGFQLRLLGSTEIGDGTGRDGRKVLDHYLRTVLRGIDNIRQGRPCYASGDDLVAFSGGSRRHVIRALQVLEERGVIAVQPSIRKNHYTIVWSELAVLAERQRRVRESLKHLSTVPLGHSPLCPTGTLHCATRAHSTVPLGHSPLCPSGTLTIPPQTKKQSAATRGARQDGGGGTLVLFSGEDPDEPEAEPDPEEDPPEAPDPPEPPIDPDKGYVVDEDAVILSILVDAKVERLASCQAAVRRAGLTAEQVRVLAQTAFANAKARRLRDPAKSLAHRLLSGDWPARIKTLEEIAEDSRRSEVRRTDREAERAREIELSDERNEGLERKLGKVLDAMEDGDLRALLDQSGASALLLKSPRALIYRELVLELLDQSC